MTKTQKHPLVYLYDAATALNHIHKGEAQLMVGASVYLGKGVVWGQYAKLYEEVYCKQGKRILREDGVLVVIQTNAYEDGEFICRYHGLCELMFEWDWELVDERVWERKAADHFQVPFSHVLVFRPPCGTAKRNQLNKRSKAWFQGIWRYRQTHGGELNSYPDELCRVLVEGCTDPGGLVVDPFAGTGALLRVACQLGRKAIGCELNPELLPTLLNNGCWVMDGKGHIQRPKEFEHTFGKREPYGKKDK